jgi:hypothetical protein
VVGDTGERGWWPLDGCAVIGRIGGH